MSEQIKVQIIVENEKCMPRKGTPGSSGYDLVNNGGQQTIMPGESKIFNTGVRIKLPESFEGQGRPRSGLMFGHGVVSGFGTIDSDYIGEIKAILFNLGKDPYVVAPYERVAQLVIAKSETVHFDPVLSLPETERGKKGFGHTGK